VELIRSNNFQVTYLLTLKKYIPGNKRVAREAPIILDAVKVGVTYSAIQHLKPDIIIPSCPAAYNHVNKNIIDLTTATNF
jgi:hypothetical protein